jgi:hypothetical protein
MSYSLNFHDYLNKISRTGGRSIVNPSRFSEAGGGGVALHGPHPRYAPDNK